MANGIFDNGALLSKWFGKKKSISAANYVVSLVEKGQLTDLEASLSWVEGQVDVVLADELLQFAFD